MKKAIITLVIINGFIINSYGSTTSFGPAPYYGYNNCGQAYAQDTPPEGVYAKAIGQTFVTPHVEAEQVLQPTGFSTFFTGAANYSYGQVRWRLWSWDNTNKVPVSIIYEYTTQGDVSYIGDRSDIRIVSSGWMHNGDNPTNKDWLFRNWRFGNESLQGDTMYYWEVEVLQNVYPLTGNVMDYIRLGWGATESGAASSNWTTGAAYQRNSDGSVAQILPQYGECDTNFKFEYRVYDDPLTYTPPRLTVGPAAYDGYINAGTAYAQDSPPAGIYEKAIGQTFKTPIVSEGQVLKLSGFSTTFTGYANYSYGHTKFTLWSWDAETSTPDAVIYEYETQNDVWVVGDRSDIRVRPESIWMHNGDNPINKDWLFRNWNLGENELQGDTMYYWEVEVLNSVYPPTVMDYIKLGWGATESGSSGGNWTTGAAYQRYSDGSIQQLLAEYGQLDVNFKMELDVYANPSNCSQVAAAGVTLAADLNKDCEINFADFALIAQNWLKCNNPEDADCSFN